ncbi:hypothetical protein HCN52_00545 [Streptomyces bohaiensis]|uniref:Uncharacterized protein n=1 Tax=Streptomyces bohaiensis TaxID=1431344 RepID=A0ABX1C8C6_9ACTN|nr:hypothetical protein [Streptomyces bohaiensis]
MLLDALFHSELFVKLLARSAVGVPADRTQGTHHGQGLLQHLCAGQAQRDTAESTF